MHRSLKTFALPLLLMVAIFLLSSIPSKVDDEAMRLLVEPDPQLQNLLHIPMFGLLQWLWLRAYAGIGRVDGCTVLTCGAITAGYGVFDEFHQLIVPGRFASLTDVLLNLVGVVIGTLVFWWITPSRRRMASAG